MTNYWAMKLKTNDHRCDRVKECRDKSVISLSKKGIIYKDLNISNNMREAKNVLTPQWYKMIYNFTSKMEIGDVVFIMEGYNVIRGITVVTSNYFYSENIQLKENFEGELINWNHHHEVLWLTGNDYHFDLEANGFPKLPVRQTLLRIDEKYKEIIDLVKSEIDRLKNN